MCQLHKTYKPNHYLAKYKMLFNFHDSSIVMVFNRLKKRIEFWSEVNSDYFFSEDVENELTDLQLRMNEKLSALEITINKLLEEVESEMGPVNKWNYGESNMHFHIQMFENLQNYASLERNFLEYYTYDIMKKIGPKVGDELEAQWEYAPVPWYK